VPELGQDGALVFDRKKVEGGHDFVVVVAMAHGDSEAKTLKLAYRIEPMF
jgi:hypothetical protein